MIRACDTVVQNDGVVWIDADGNPTDEWEKTVTRFTVGGEASYHLYSDGTAGVIRVKATGGGTAVLAFDGEVLGTYAVGDGEIAAEIPGHDGTLGIRCTDGTFDGEFISFDIKT